MKKTIAFVLLLASALFLGGCGLAAGKASSAAAGEEPRLISTSVSICKILDTMEIDLVGVPDSSYELPQRYDAVTRVGMPMSPDLEIIRSLHPTAIIGPNALQYDLQPQFESIGVSSVFMDLMSVEGMLKSIEELGELYDRRTQAAAILDDYTSFMAEYNHSVAAEEKPTVLLLMGLPGSYMVATEHSYVGNLVKLAGGVNVFSGDEAFLTLNTEAIAETDPDIILRAAHGLPEEVKESFVKEFAENDIWKHFRAVQEGKVYDLDYNIFNMTANLDYQQALLALKEMLYGD